MNKFYIIFNMNKILLLLSFLTNSYSQSLTCNDFKEGKFIVPSNKIIPKEHYIIREGNNQTEYVEESGQELLIYGAIEWIDNCSYIIKFDGSKMELTDDLKFINENGGIVTSLLNIEGRCFFYKSVLVIEEKEVYRFDGQFCKE